MSKRFNPLSAGVAAATASVILGIAGCAMGTQSPTVDPNDTAGLSRESTDNSQAPVAQAEPAPAPTVAMDTPVQPAPIADPMATTDTAAIPPADATPAAGATYPGMDVSTAAKDTTGTNDMSATSSTSSMDTTATAPDSSEQPLPPRADRN